MPLIYAAVIVRSREFIARILAQPVLMTKECSWLGRAVFVVMRAHIF